MPLGPLFGIAGELTDFRPLGGGHIHQTFLARYRGAPAVVHQRLNTAVFGDLDLLMDNFVRVTAHLGAKAGDPRRAVRLWPAADGRPFALDAAGAPWRTLALIDRACSHPRFDGSAQAAAAAGVAARLVADLADLAPPPAEVIGGFHDIPRRLAALDQARATDERGRAAACAADVDAVLAHAGIAAQVAAARLDGRLPERTVHNDTKADNLLVDEATGEALCLVDLDTVGPGTILFDVGDLVRSGAVRGGEDADIDAVTIDAAVAGAVLDGYAATGAGFLTAGELDLLPLAGPLMALEAAARFLTDHLRGDVYFRVDGPGHNLRRARNQLRVLELLLGA